MRLFEREILWNASLEAGVTWDRMAALIESSLAPGESAVRFAVTGATPTGLACELGVLSDWGHRPPPRSIVEMRRRRSENTDRFNVCLLVPTGINARIGGHAGDAGAIAGLIAGACDTLITHPNVVNGSDYNELPSNGLYVEGSVLSRWLAGVVGLGRSRGNRVLLVIDAHPEAAYSHAAINALNGARACYGLSSPRVVQLDPGVRLISSYSSSGRAVGRVEGMAPLAQALDRHREEFDAVAISTVIQVPPGFHEDYFNSGGDMVNPWGGVEAVFTHALSLLYDVPTAHSPMLESEEIEDLDPGVVDPRMAAEAASLTFLPCVLKGLKDSPRIVTDPLELNRPDILTARDVSALVIPEGCLGLPVLAALEQGIPVIAVRENQTLCRLPISALPWRPGQYHVAQNYLEAVGILTAIRRGLSLETLRRPVLPVPVTTWKGESQEEAASPRATVTRQIHANDGAGDKVGAAP